MVITWNPLNTQNRNEWLVADNFIIIISKISTYLDNTINILHHQQCNLHTNTIACFQHFAILWDTTILYVLNFLESLLNIKSIPVLHSYVLDFISNLLYGYGSNSLKQKLYTT